MGLLNFLVTYFCVIILEVGPWNSFDNKTWTYSHKNLWTSFLTFFLLKRIIHSHTPFFSCVCVLFILLAGWQMDKGGDDTSVVNSWHSYPPLSVGVSPKRVHSPTDMSRELRTVTTAARARPHLDFTMSILPARRTEDALRTEVTQQQFLSNTSLPTPGLSGKLMILSVLNGRHEPQTWAFYSNISSLLKNEIFKCCKKKMNASRSYFQTK